MKIKSQSKSSGQILVIVIILLVLLGIAYWWLDSNKRQMAREGDQFGKQVIQELIMQHNVKFFADHLSPAMRLQYPPSAQQDLMTQLAKLGAPLSPPKVEGDIVFESHFFEPNSNFLAHFALHACAVSLLIHGKERFIRFVHMAANANRTFRH